MEAAIHHLYLPIVDSDLIILGHLASENVMGVPLYHSTGQVGPRFGKSMLGAALTKTFL